MVYLNFNWKHVRRECSSIDGPCDQFAYYPVGTTFVSSISVHSKVTVARQNHTHALTPVREKNNEVAIAPAINMSHAPLKASQVTTSH